MVFEGTELYDHHFFIEVVSWHLLPPFFSELISSLQVTGHCSFNSSGHLSTRSSYKDEQSLCCFCTDYVQPH